MDDVLAFSNGLAAAVERTSRVVFGVNGRPRLGSTGVHWRPGLIVTSDHTVQVDEDLTVVRPDGRTVAATVAGRDPTIDVAVLKVEAPDVPVAEVGDSDAVRVGHIVLAVGTGPRASWGVVSSIGGEGEGRRAGEDIFSLDLTLYPGFSGGPLIDARGRVIGVNTSGAARRLQLAIPAARIHRVLDGLARRGHIPRAYLGVSTQPVRLPETIRPRLNADQETAVIVVAVQPASPAAAAGMLIGDVIVSLGGTVIADPMDLKRVLQPDRVGENIIASVIRGGEPRDIELRVGERPPRT